jgi:hypothetical protein
MTTHPTLVPKVGLAVDFPGIFKDEFEGVFLHN